MRLLRAAAQRLAAALAVAGVAAWAVAVAAGAHLAVPAPTAFITDSHGVFMTQAGHESLRPGGGRQVEYGYWPVAPPERVVRATLALEDRRFWSHPGVDPAAVLRAVWQHVRGGHGSGASTLAMQVARMQHPRPRTLWAKAVEAGTALALTARYGRAAVLAQYLRLAPYGEGSHGIAHAAEWYFGKPAADLDWAEAAMLAAVPQAPGLMALHRHAAKAAARGRLALLTLNNPLPLREDRVRAVPSDGCTPQGNPLPNAGEMDAALCRLADLQPRPAPRRPEFLTLALKLQRMALPCALLPAKALAYVSGPFAAVGGGQDEGAASARAGFGSLAPTTLTPALSRQREREKNGQPEATEMPWQAGEGGCVLRSTIDLALQRDLARMAVTHLAVWRPAGAQQVAVMVARRGSRAVLVDVTSAGDGSRPGGAIDYSATLRSPGSTLKPFLYALGLDRDTIAPQDVLADLPEGSAGINNADHDFLGPLLPRQALANSRNVPATNLLRRIGLAEGFGFLRRMGLHDLDGPADRFGLAMAIGALPTSLERLMRGYATLAEDGVDAKLRWFSGPGGPARRLVSVESARLVGRFLSDPMARLPAFPRYGASEFPFAVALKTGTSQGYRDAWTLAWSRDFVVGVWVGRADAGPMTRLSGARAAGQLAQAVMLRLHGGTRSDLVAGEFAAPPGRVQAELCTGTGRNADSACPERLVEWVRPGSAPPPAPASPRLAIVQPDPNTHVWRNPEAPAALNRLVLRATVEPAVPQLVWMVDGQAVATTAADAPFYWPMVPGHHRFQVRLPLEPAVSRPVAVVVE